MAYTYPDVVVERVACHEGPGEAERGVGGVLATGQQRPVLDRVHLRAAEVGRVPVLAKRKEEIL